MALYCLFCLIVDLSLFYNASLALLVFFASPYYVLLIPYRLDLLVLTWNLGVCIVSIFGYWDHQYMRTLGVVCLRTLCLLVYDGYYAIMSFIILCLVCFGHGRYHWILRSPVWANIGGAVGVFGPWACSEHISPLGCLWFWYIDIHVYLFDLKAQA